MCGRRGRQAGLVAAGLWLSVPCSPRGSPRTVGAANALRPAWQHQLLVTRGVTDVDSEDQTTITNVILTINLYFYLNASIGPT